MVLWGGSVVMLNGQKLVYFVSRNNQSSSLVPVVGLIDGPIRHSERALVNRVH